MSEVLTVGGHPLTYGGVYLGLDTPKGNISLTYTTTGTGTPQSTIYVTVDFDRTIRLKENGRLFPSDTHRYYYHPISNGETIVLGNIPEGTKYVVTFNEVYNSEFNDITIQNYDGVVGGYSTCAVTIVADYEPLIAAKTIRLRYDTGITPTIPSWAQVPTGTTLTQIDQANNVWDLYIPSTDWSAFFTPFLTEMHVQDIVEIVDVNADGVTNMSGLFRMNSVWPGTKLTNARIRNTSSCQNFSYLLDGSNLLTTVKGIFLDSDTNGYDVNATRMLYGCSALTHTGIWLANKLINSQVTHGDITYDFIIDTPIMSGMFGNCTSLTSIPYFFMSTSAFYPAGAAWHSVSGVYNDWSALFKGCTGLVKISDGFDWTPQTDTSSMFEGCVNVQGGALSLYNKLQNNYQGVERYTDCFKDCGSNTTTGAAELAQIPSSWGGTGS